jgi:hypothetical protein
LKNFKVDRAATYSAKRSNQLNYLTKEKKMEIKKSQIRAKNWKIGNILEDVRSNSQTRNQQFHIVDYDSKTQVVFLEQTPKDFRLKAEFIFSQIIA